METLLRDIRYGLASLRNDPGFALVAIGVLALGIGTNTAMFSLVDAIFLKPLPFPHQELIVRVWESPGGTGILRTQIPPASILPSVRAAMREIDPALALGDVRTMDEIRERTLRGAKQRAWVIGAFGAVAAFLAALGIYDIVSHSVRQRRREIGIRMALGARSRDVLSQVLRGALWMVGIGLVGGLVGAFAVTRVMESLLFEVSALDPLSFVTACVAVVLVGFIATLLPASRATGVEPVSVLRDEG